MIEVPRFPADGRLATYFDPKPWRNPPRESRS